MVNRASNLQTKFSVNPETVVTKTNSSCYLYKPEPPSLDFRHSQSNKSNNCLQNKSTLLETDEKFTNANYSSLTAKTNKAGEQQKTGGVFTSLGYSSEHDLLEETKDNNYRRTKSFETLPTLMTLQSTQMFHMDQPDQGSLWMENWRLPSRRKNGDKSNQADDVAHSSEFSQRKIKAPMERRNHGLDDQRAAKSCESKVRPAKSMEDLIAIHKYSTHNQDAIRGRVLRATALKSKSQENLTANNLLSVVPMEHFAVSRSYAKSNDNITLFSPANQRATAELSKNAPQQKFMYKSAGRIEPILNVQEDVNANILNPSIRQRPNQHVPSSIAVTFSGAESRKVSKQPVLHSDDNPHASKNVTQKKRLYNHSPFMVTPEVTKLSLKSVNKSEKQETYPVSRNVEPQKSLTGATILNGPKDIDSRNTTPGKKTPQTNKTRPAVKNFPQELQSFHQELSNKKAIQTYNTQKLDVMNASKSHPRTPQEPPQARNEFIKNVVVTKPSSKQSKANIQEQQNVDDVTDYQVPLQSRILNKAKTGNVSKLSRAEQPVKSNFQTKDESTAVNQMHSSKFRSQKRTNSRSNAARNTALLKLQLDSRDERQEGLLAEGGVESAGARKYTRETPNEHGGDPADRSSLLDETLSTPAQDPNYLGRGHDHEQREQDLETDLASEIPTRRQLEGDHCLDHIKKFNKHYNFDPCNSDDSENVAFLVDELTFNKNDSSSCIQPCFNDVMTRIASSTMSHSDRSDSSGSLWEDDDFAMEATARVCELLQWIEQLLYNGHRAPALPERVVHECNQWRLLFPQLRIEATSSLSSRRGQNAYQEEEEEKEEFELEKNDFTGISFYGDSVNFFEPLSKRRTKHPKLHSSKSRSIADFGVEGQECVFHDLPKLMRSFDDFTHKTIPLIFEQLVEEIFYQDGNFEELIAFDQENCWWDSCGHLQQQKFHVPRNKTGIPPVTRFAFRVDDFVRQIFHSLWKELLPSLRQYTGARMSGFTSAALRELLVTPEMNPLMDKFLDSHPLDPSLLSPPTTSNQVNSTRTEIRIPTAGQDLRPITSSHSSLIQSNQRSRCEKSSTQNVAATSRSPEERNGPSQTPSNFHRQEVVVKKKTKPDTVPVITPGARTSYSRHHIDIHKDRPGVHRGYLKTPPNGVKRIDTQENDVPNDSRAHGNDLDFNQFISGYSTTTHLNKHTASSANPEQQHLPPRTAVAPKGTPIYSRQTKGVFKTPTSTAGDRKLLQSTSFSSRQQNPLYFV